MLHRIISSLHHQADIYNAVVVGLGVAGSAALQSLAKQGLTKVLGLEQYSIANNLGSSTGDSRIIRLVYQEHPSYVSLLQHAYPLWRALENETGKSLLTTTGVVNVSAPTGIAAHGHSTFTGALESAIAHGLNYGILTPQEFKRRYPGVFESIPDDFSILLDPAGGFLNPEESIRSFVDVAKYHGAEVRTGVGCKHWRVLNNNIIEITTTQGDTIHTKKLILSGGMWMTQLVPSLQSLFTIERQVLGWFKPPTENWQDYTAEANFPCFLIDDADGYYYGFPYQEPYGVKIGKYNHLLQHYTDPDAVDRTVHKEDEIALRQGLELCLPGLAKGPMTKAIVCCFTNTPDGHFLIDLHPKYSNVVIGSACSGHGFKFGPVIGEALMQLVLEGDTEYDIGLHRFNRDRIGHDEVLNKLLAED